MAELSENDINNIISRIADAINNSELSAKSDKTTQLLRTLNTKAERTVRAIKQSTKSAFSIAADSSKEYTKEKAQEVTSSKEKLTSDKENTNVFQQMSSYLEEINETLKRAYAPDPTKLSGATQDADSPPIKEKEEVKKQAEKKAEDKKSSSVPWLSLLFAGGAVAAISKAFGIGAGAGVTGGVLAKLLPAVLGPFKAIARRIPIIGSLFSFYEAYKKFKQGGIDNIVFGVMDIAAGIAYAFPGVGTAIGLGLDVLQYFLKNKADEWKAETGETSFFGSLWDSMIGYLKQTPIFEWFIKTGEKAKEFWDKPTWETFKAFAQQYGSILEPLLATFSMFNDDAGAALGLTDESGETQGLFGWIADKVDEWFITPVMDFLESIFVSIGEGIMSLGNSMSMFMKRAVDNNVPDGWTKDSLYWIMGWSDQEPEGGFGEVEEFREEKEQLAPGLAKIREADQERIKQWGELVGGKWTEKEYLDSLDNMSDEQIAEQLQILKQKATRRGLRFKKIPDTQNIPKPQSMMGPEATRFRSQQQTTNNIVNTNVTNNVAALTPSQGFAY
jgi:hypothetical protein